MHKERFTILIIDDDRERNHYLKKILTPLGYEIHYVFNGADCLPKLDELHPEMILLDVNLPDCNGFDLLKTIKEHSNGRRSFVVMISSVFIDSIDQARGLENGADGYLVLPLANRELIARVHAFTRHKQVIDQLQMMELQLRTALDHNMEGILILDDQGKILYANKASHRFFQKSQDDLTTLDFGLPLIQDNMTTINMSVNGEVITAEMKLTQAMLEERKVTIVSLTDVTAFHLSERTMRTQIEEMTRKEHHQDQLFSIIAHDLRSPFNTLINFSEILSQDYHSMETEEIGKIAGLIHRSSGKIFNLLVNLLDWSRLRMGQISIHRSDVLLFPFLSEIISVFQETADQKGINLINGIESKASLYCDENILRTLLRNLISNAIKFTPRAGTVKVELTTDTHRTIISVIDTGRGMTQEKLARLFDPDQKRFEADSESGTGLGLMLCRELITLSGGELEIRSEPGKGTIVHCIFPHQNLSDH